MIRLRPPGRFGGASRLVSGVTLACVAAGCSGEPGDPFRASAPAASAHVGTAVCAGCHVEQAEAWRGSHHDLAMQAATDDTVLGDFDDASFSYGDVTTTFYRRAGKFGVRTEGPDGTLQDYEIAYTFGVDPLQQYLASFPGGRYQALGIAWDARPAANGGQRWFHLYPGGEVDHRDPLHWTGPWQNWNSTCADCHSTDLRKGYEPQTDTYSTTWSEIDVACEACHGPGSRHVAWAEHPDRGPDPGLDVRYPGDPRGWTFAAGAVTARREPVRADRTEIEACGRCHARRASLTDAYTHGRPLADTHRVALLEESLYHADGQIEDEVYVYGSFLQSRMYHEGVTCSDCHDPHTAKLRTTGNATCSPCHRAEHFDTPRHHFHEHGTPGASCVGCHMPERVYMIVDPRHDHSFRVPRPDLAERLGTPEPCTACHVDRDPAWAASAVAGWYGAGRRAEPHYGAALHAGRSYASGAPDALRRLASDRSAPAIARGTALDLLRRYPSPATFAVASEAIADSDPLVRRAAIGPLESLEPAPRVEIIQPLLDDPLRSVRLEAARALAAVPRERLPERRLAAVERALAVYATALHLAADGVEGRMNLGWLELRQGRTEEARRQFQAAVVRAPGFPPAAINLADVHRLAGNDREGETVLRTALAASPDDPDLHHALGLLLVRGKRHDESIDHFARAVERAPHRPELAYVFAVALHSTHRTARALEVLREAHAATPAHDGILFLLATVSRDAGDREAAKRYARQLLDREPGHAGAAAMLAAPDVER